MLSRSGGEENKPSHGVFDIWKPCAQAFGIDHLAGDCMHASTERTWYLWPICQLKVSFGFYVPPVLLVFVAIGSQTVIGFKGDSYQALPIAVQLNTLIPLVFPFKCVNKLFRLLFNIQNVVTFSKYLVASEVILWEVRDTLPVLKSATKAAWPSTTWKISPSKYTDRENLHLNLQLPAFLHLKFYLLLYND